MKKKWQSINVWLLVPLLLGSGLCALVYQVVWLRELRVVFGSSTAASGMVLAVFMGGLGGGAVFFGRKADVYPRPLYLYAILELGIAISAALSPLLIYLSRYLYVALGGSLAMGLPLAMALRVFLSAIILLVPTFLMGGTLPAAARAVETENDQGRRDLALLYGVNGLGGVIGVVVATFFILEVLGNRTTLGAAAFINLLVGIFAYFLAGRLRDHEKKPDRPDREIEEASPESGGKVNCPVPSTYIYAAAFITGFSFLLMELVWYRMLTPVLGGTTYTFGLILAVALAGIGLGATFFSMRRRESRTTLSAFVFICGLEALFMAVPYALGDKLAIATALLRPLGNVGFHGQIFAWTIITSIVILPAAIMAGIQFPMLIGLLGRGRRKVGHHSGYVYGWNTAGAILGSLAGGFGLMPLLTAPGCWQMVVWLLAFLGGAAIFFSWQKEGKRISILAATVIIMAAVTLLTAEGPSAAWRHGAIGVGQDVHLSMNDRNGIRRWVNLIKRRTIWEREGMESSVAISAEEGISFFINGKSDGHAIGDAGTQVMGPLVGAVLHPAPKRGMVIGLGTGSSAGWLAGIGSMERVDVVELEPAIREVAKRCAPVNRNVLENQKVRVIIGDGREVLQAGSGQYDVIFSEPSNPYRAGIASLYTREFYRAVSRRLAPGGYFSQWVQGYYIDPGTLRTICATLASVFPDVEIWLTKEADILFVCSSQPKKYQLPGLRQRLAREPFRSAMLAAWGVEGLEGFLAGFVAGPELVRMIAEQEAAGRGRINTDDRMLVEFGFARAAGKTLFSVEKWRRTIREMNMHRPRLSGSAVRWSEVDENFFQMMLWMQVEINPGLGFSPDQEQRAVINDEFNKGNLQFVLDAWQKRERNEISPRELAQFGMALAEVGDERAIGYAERLQGDWIAEADAIMARYFWRLGDYENAFFGLDRALKGFRKSPWRVRGVLRHTIKLAQEMAMYKQFTEPVYDLLSQPFSVYNMEGYRRESLLVVASLLGDRKSAEVIALSEPSVPWNENYLRYRLRSYKNSGEPLVENADRDLQEYLDALPDDFFNPPTND